MKIRTGGPHRPAVNVSVTPHCNFTLRLPGYGVRKCPPTGLQGLFTLESPHQVAPLAGDGGEALGVEGDVLRPVRGEQIPQPRGVRLRRGRRSVTRSLVNTSFTPHLHLVWSSFK